MLPKRINIMTVDMGQPLYALREWVAQRGFGRHVIQALSPKNDYARRYTVNSQVIMPSRPSTCAFLERNLMRFFTWAGKELPCCFMKDVVEYTTSTKLQSQLAYGEAPTCCAGCAHLDRIDIPTN